jgi:hypothetical protein
LVHSLASYPAFPQRGQYVIKLIPDAFVTKIKAGDNALQPPRPNRSLFFTEFRRKLSLSEQQPTTATVILFPLAPRLLPVITWPTHLLSFFHFVFLLPRFPSLAATARETRAQKKAASASAA